MRSRIATAATLLALVAGTGGAIAIGQSGPSNGGQGGAATAQYKPGKGCGDKNHRHKKHNQCKGPKPKPQQPTNHHKAQKPKPAHKPSSKKGHAHTVPCKVRLVGQTLIAFCPTP